MLLINTCGAEGIVGLGSLQGLEGVVLGEARLPGRSASEDLITVVRRLLEGQGWGIGEVEVVGVVVGPGSFTGVRVGLAAAKGFCDAGGKKMVAISRLELLASGGGVGVLDAGRGEFFVGAGGVREGIAGRAGVVELGVQLVTCEARVVTALEGTSVRVVGEPGAAEMLAMVMARAAAGAWSDVGETDANYLRRTDAELIMTARGGRG